MQETANPSTSHTRNPSTFSGDEITFKIILVGSPGVGKTSIFKRYIHRKFSENYDATIGAEFGSKIIDINPTTKLRLQIWDTAGQESFVNIVKSFYKGANVVFLVYSVLKRDTFGALSTWLKDVLEYCDPDSILVLVGNQEDAPNERQVKYEEGVSFMKEHNLHFFFETSALKGKNIDLAFLEAVKLAYMGYLQDKADGRGSYIYNKTDAINLKAAAHTKTDEDKIKEQQQQQCNC